MQYKAYDIAFIDAVRKAGASLIPKRKPKKRYSDGDDLAKLLRSDYPLGEVERDLLAQLVTGEFQRNRGAQPVGIGLMHITTTVMYFRECLTNGEMEKKAIKKAQDFLEENFDIKASKSTIRKWNLETKKRDEIIKTNEELIKKNSR